MIKRGKNSYYCKKLYSHKKLDKNTFVVYYYIPEYLIRFHEVGRICQ